MSTAYHEETPMQFDLDEILILLAFEAKTIDMETACAALGITRRELTGWELAAIGEGRDLAIEKAAA